MAIQAVFSSWNNQRAIVYRRINKIDDNMGTAVNVQCMAFGNMGEDSGTGVAFTRNHSTRDKELYGEFLVNAQGEDVVAGIRTPTPISKLKDSLPGVYQQFVDTCMSLKNLIAICRTLNLLWKEASFICCKLAAASAMPKHR
jgi:pyruvate,orthophosphate dikinase